jgi:hypothetical protein
MNSKGHCNPKKQDKAKTLERMNGDMKNLDIHTLYGNIIIVPQNSFILINIITINLTKLRLFHYMLF